MAPALDSGGTFLPKSYTRVALARAGRTSRTSNENNNTHTSHTHILHAGLHTAHWCPCSPNVADHGERGGVRRRRRIRQRRRRGSFFHGPATDGAATPTDTAIAVEMRSPETSWCKMSFVYFSRLAMSARGDAMTSCSGNVERTPCLSTKLCATAVGGWDGVRAVTCEGAGFTGS